MNFFFLRFFTALKKKNSCRFIIEFIFSKTCRVGIFVYRYASLVLNTKELYNTIKYNYKIYKGKIKIV